MKDPFCLRNIPADLRQWIEETTFERREKISPFIVSILKSARTNGSLPGLFDGRPVIHPAKAAIVPFKFIDLFAGIGGFRLGLQRVGGQCVFSSEWDKFSQQTYEAWFDEKPHGDINEVDPQDIPDHDVLTAGFPCQPFSIAGVSKKQSLGQAHGFKCERQGNLFFRICDVVKEKRPPVLILENVKNLRSHDKKRTWAVIRDSLDQLGYTVFYKIIDAADYVPQHRERIFIVCFDTQLFGSDIPFQFPSPPDGPRPKFRSILEKNPPERYTLTDHLWNYLQQYAAKHKAKGNGFGYGMTDLDGVSRTLSARYYKDGSEVLIPQGKKRNPRRLTIVEAARLMGFTETVNHRDDVPVSDTQAYKQFGNAVCPHVVEAVARKVVDVMRETHENRGNGCLLKRSGKRTIKRLAAAG